LASSILRKTSVSKTHCEVVSGFVCKFLVAHGNTVEKVASASQNGSSVRDSDREVAELLEELMSSTVAAVQESLGSIWICRSEQGNGQDAFESKPLPVQKPQAKSNESLAGILSFLQQALVSCPIFLLHIPAAPGNGRDDNKLLRKAIDAAVESLNDSDPEITRNSIYFLKTLVWIHTCSVSCFSRGIATSHSLSHIVSSLNSVSRKFPN
jgi:hypothetical protein